MAGGGRKTIVVMRLATYTYCSPGTFPDQSQMLIMMMTTTMMMATGVNKKLFFKPPVMDLDNFQNCL